MVSLSVNDDFLPHHATSDPRMSIVNLLNPSQPASMTEGLEVVSRSSMILSTQSFYGHYEVSKAKQHSSGKEIKLQAAPIQKARIGRKAFVASITMPSPRRGFLACRLCLNEIWGPNGKLLLR